MGFFGPLIYILFANASMVLISKKTFGKCLPITLMLSAFTLLFSQIVLKTFSIGIIINLIFALIFIFLLIKNRKRKKFIDEYKTRLFSKGFYAFITIYVLIFILDFNRTFSMWDEKSHWGVMIKEMLRLDKFYSVKASTLLVHKDYPPILQIFEYFWCKLSFSYKEAYLIRAVHVFEFSLFIPALVEVNKKLNKSLKISTIFNTIAITGIIFLMLLLFDQHNIVNCIYNDYFMAILVAYGINLIVFEKNTLNNFSLISISIAMSFLLLTKQMGLPLYFIVIFMFLIDLILKNRKKIKFKKIFSKKKFIEFTKVFIIIMVIPLLFWKGWNNYVDSLKIEKQFDIADLKIMELPNILKGTYGEKWQNTAAKNYVMALKIRNLTTSTMINLTYVQGIVLFVVLLSLAWYIGKKYFYKGQICLIGIDVIIGAIGYAILMLIMYVFSFGSIEGVNIASFDRYMDTYMIIMLSVIIMLYIWIFSQKRIKIQYLYFICAMMFLIQSSKKSASIYPKLLKSDKDEFEICANIIKSKVKNEANVFIIAQDTPGNYQFFVKYYADKINTNLKYFHFPLNEETNYKKYYNSIKKYILNYDYVFIASISNEMIEKYAFVFPNKNVEKFQLYKVTKKNNNPNLELIK